MLVTGRAVGEKIASGPVRIVADAQSLATSSRARCWSPNDHARTGSR